VFGRRKKWSFEARAVGFLADDDTETEMLALAEHEDGSGEHLMVQRSYEDDAQDVALGWDRHCLVADTGWCFYGAFAAWSVEGNTLRLELTEEAAAECSFTAVLARLPDDEAVHVAVESMPRLMGRDGPERGQG
jgi:hypothetical protein